MRLRHRAAVRRIVQLAWLEGLALLVCPRAALADSIPPSPWAWQYLAFEGDLPTFAATGVAVLSVTLLGLLGLSLIARDVASLGAGP